MNLQESLPLMFHTAKIWLVDVTGVSRDALHIYVAIALFLTVRILFRGWPGTVIALLVVAGAALTGEWLDHQVEMLNGGLCDRAEHWHDLRNTMFGPFVLALALPLLRSGRRKPPEPETPVSGENAERSLEQA